MPAHPFQTNFTGGEMTEQLLARVDWQKYANGAACLKNFLPRTHGGAARRAGTMYLGSVRDPSVPVRLVKFEFSVTQAYILEFGDLYIRFWANRTRLEVAGVPVEVVTPYTAGELRTLRFEQSADVLYIAHPDHAPMKLQRTSATEFQLDPIHFHPPTPCRRENLPAGRPCDARGRHWRRGGLLCERRRLARGRRGTADQERSRARRHYRVHLDHASHRHDH